MNIFIYFTRKWWIRKKRKEQQQQQKSYVQQKRRQVDTRKQYEYNKHIWLLGVHASANYRNEILLAVSNLFNFSESLTLSSWKTKYDWHSIMVCKLFVWIISLKRGWIGLRNLRMWYLSCLKDRSLNRKVKLVYICYWLIATLYLLRRKSAYFTKNTIYLIGMVQQDGPEVSRLRCNRCNNVVKYNVQYDS